MRSFLPFPLLPKAGFLIPKPFLTDDCLACSEKIKWWRLHNFPRQSIPVLNCPNHYSHLICGVHKGWHSFHTKGKGLLEHTGPWILVAWFSCDVQDGSFPAHSAFWHRLGLWKKAAAKSPFPELLVNLSTQELTPPCRVKPQHGCQHTPCSPRNFVWLELSNFVHFFLGFLDMCRTYAVNKCETPTGGWDSSMWRAAAGIFSTHLCCMQGWKGGKGEEGLE